MSPQPFRTLPFTVLVKALLLLNITAVQAIVPVDAAVATSLRRLRVVARARIRPPTHYVHVVGWRLVAEIAAVGIKRLSVGCGVDERLR